MATNRNGHPHFGRRARLPLTSWHRYHQNALHRSRPRRGALWPLFFSFILATTLLVVAAAGFVATAFARFTEELPSADGLANQKVFQTTKFYDRTGNTLLYEFYDPTGGKRTKVPLESISPVMIAAQLSAEDKNFYSNPGFDPVAIVRAFAANTVGGSITSGASTITQQLVRNMLLEPDERNDRSYVRKLKEVTLSFFVNQRYSKDDILEMYLNHVYYGNMAFGVEAAAETFFGKTVSDLTLAEASMLAGLPQAPSAYNPYINPTAAKSRQIYVLERMVEDGYITLEQAQAAADQPLQFRRDESIIRAPHFVFYVRDLLIEKYGKDAFYHDGLKVITTIDLQKQQIGEQVVKDRMAEIRSRQTGANNAALVAIDPNTGEILTMVGSADYYDESIDGAVNVASSLRQPGSTLKPIVYALAFMKGWNPDTKIDDAPISLDDNGRIWAPRNWDDKFHGQVTVRSALGNSLNIPAIKALEFVGVKSFIEKAREMGLHSLQEDGYYGLSVVIGGAEIKPIELAGAYAAFAAGGIYREPTAILKVTNSAGQVLEEHQPGPGRRVLPANVVAQITNILADGPNRAMTYGPPPTALDLSRPAAAKTGTTDDSRDLWVAGYTPDLVGVVWVGNTQGRPTQRTTGGTTAAPVWHDFMERALAGVPPHQFPQPSGGNAQKPSATPTPSARPNTSPTPRPSPSAAPSPAAPTPQPPASPTAPAPPASPTPAPTPAPASTQAPPAAGVAVPKVVGLPEDQARAQLASAGFAVGPTNYQGHDVLPDRILQAVCVGCVLSSLPGGGTQAPQGSTVYIAVRKD